MDRVFLSVQRDDGRMRWLSKPGILRRFRESLGTCRGGVIKAPPADVPLVRAETRNLLYPHPHT